jgi:elongator complex protein 6
MTTNSRIPPLLSPYIVSPPENSLILLTSTLGTSANWILTRYLCSALAGDAGKSRRTAPKPQEYGGLNEVNTRLSVSSASNNGGNEDYAVVIVSWMRDCDFWRAEGRRTAVSTDTSRVLLAWRMAMNRTWLIKPSK